MLFLKRAGPRFQIACSVLDAIKASRALVDAPIVVAFGFRCGDQSRWTAGAGVKQCSLSSRKWDCVNQAGSMEESSRAEDLIDDHLELIKQKWAEHLG